MKIIPTLLLFFIVIKMHGQTQYEHKRIIVFKDGTAFIEKSTTVPIKNKMVFLYPTPFTNLYNEDEVITYSRRNNIISQNKRIIFGSLRFQSPNNKITEVAYLDTIISKSEKFNSYGPSIELFHENIGKQVSLGIGNSPKPIEGKIVSIVNNLPNSTPSIVVQSEKTYYLINSDQIQSVTFIPFEQNFKMNEAKKTQESAIRLSFQNNAENQNITISYLQKGITWMPNYFIDLKEKNIATISLFATLMNDIENIQNADFYFAVGIPSFTYSYVNSPMTTKTDVLQVLSELSNPPEEANAGIHRTMSQRGNPIDANFGTNYTAQFEGRGQEELYFYKKEKISVGFKNRTLLPLFEEEITYTDIYEADLNTNLESNREHELELEKENQVWRSIKFKNTTTYPFTTGEVFFVKKGDIEIKGLSQNEIRYTPSNEYTTVKVNMTPDIQVSQKDQELSRERRGDYSLLTVESFINIVNLKPIDIKLNVNRNINGDLLNSNKEWKYSTLMGKNGNKLNVIKWSLEVGAGKAMEIKYTYKVLVRNY
jgi:hypothetical protein